LVIKVEYVVLRKSATEAPSASAGFEAFQAAAMSSVCTVPPTNFARALAKSISIAAATLWLALVGKPMVLIFVGYLGWVVAKEV
jgi:hypothetical protein